MKGRQRNESTLSTDSKWDVLVVPYQSHVKVEMNKVCFIINVLWPERRFETFYPLNPQRQKTMSLIIYPLLHASLQWFTQFVSLWKPECETDEWWLFCVKHGVIILAVRILSQSRPQLWKMQCLFFFSMATKPRSSYCVAQLSVSCPPSHAISRCSWF